MKKFIFTALLSLSLVAQDQNIFYKDADIKTFAQDIALLTDKTIILDPRVKGVIQYILMHLLIRILFGKCLFRQWKYRVTMY